MRIAQLTIENFGPFEGIHTLNLAGRGLLAVMGTNHDGLKADSNGSGKSHIPDAIDWCLWGTKRDSADGMINDIAQGNCCSQVTIEDGDQRYTVTRWRGGQGQTASKVSTDGKKHGLSLMVNGKDESALDTKETQNRIDSVLGCNEKIWHAAVHFRQGRLINFANAKKTERMDLLTEVLELGEIDRLKEHAKEKLKAAQEERTQEQAKSESLREYIQRIETTDYQHQIDAFEANRAQKRAQVVEMLKDAPEPDDVAHKREKLQALEYEYGSAVEPPETSPEIDAFLRQAHEYEQTRLAEFAKVSSLRTEMGIKGQERDRITALHGQCPTCGQHVDPSVVTQWANNLQVEISQLQAQVDAYRKRIDWFGVNERALKQKAEETSARLKAQKAPYQAWRESTIGQIHVLRQEIAAMERMLKTTESNKKLLATIDGEANPYRAAKDQAEKDLAKFKSDLKSLQNSDAAEKVAIYEFWRDALSNTGIKSYVLDARLGEMTEAANHWVRFLTGDAFWIRFETQKQIKTGELRNELTIRVFSYAPDGNILERTYEEWSGGEKQRIARGVDLGLTSLIARRAQKAWDVMILDEIFAHLDEAGKAAILDVMREIAHNKDTVVVIEHDPIITNSIRNQIIVNKRNRRSWIDDQEGKGSREAEDRQEKPTQGTSVRAENSQGAPPIVRKRRKKGTRSKSVRSR